MLWARPHDWCLQFYLGFLLGCVLLPRQTRRRPLTFILVLSWLAVSAALGPKADLVLVDQFALRRRALDHRAVCPLGELDATRAVKESQSFVSSSGLSGESELEKPRSGRRT